MKKIIVLSLFLVIRIQLLAQNDSGFFDPKQLKPGMKGYALTVFRGLEPEKMDVEVIEYMPDRMAKTGIVLVKLSGENVERSRVAAGMSGSPVYIDGKLVGALAYTWANARELLAGIVPIQDMISDKTRSQNTSFPPAQAKPIQTAWELSGIEDSEFLKKIQDISIQASYPFGVEEFEVVPSSRSNGKAPLKPGDGVAIKLIEGDINLASIGTVTYVDGEDVYIYGHPMDGEGPISLPLSRAKIYDIMSSTKLSFKLGTSLPETIGSTVFDGQSAVYGRFDRKAGTLPVEIHVVGAQYSNSYKMNMARSRKYLPTLIESGIGAVLERELGSNIEKQINVSWNIHFTNNQIVSNSVTWVKDTLYTPVSIKEYWKNYISILWNNALTHLVPEKMDLTVNIMDKPYNYFTIDSVKTSRPAYLPGETIDISVLLGTFLDQSLYTNFMLELPRDIKEGSYILIVGGALAIEMELGVAFPQSYVIRSEKQLLKELRKPILTHDLQLVLVASQDSSIAGNSFLNSVPKSRQSLFESSTFEGQPILAPKLIKTEYILANPVVGGRSVMINIVVPQPKSVSNK